MWLHDAACIGREKGGLSPPKDRRIYTPSASPEHLTESRRESLPGNTLSLIQPISSPLVNTLLFFSGTVRSPFQAFLILIYTRKSIKMMYSKTLVALVALVASAAAVPGCVPKPKYEPCGGLTPITTRDTGCNEGFTCVSDPRKPGCGLACDEPGICVPDDVAICGGIGGFTCETGLVCFDKPDDNCDPSEGADCLGICLHPPQNGPVQRI